VQFHPTGIYGSGCLMTEGCRGEGGFLTNSLVIILFKIFIKREKGSWKDMLHQQKIWHPEM